MENSTNETKKIDRYEVRAKLGEGAMAIVYKAYDPRIGRELAIKLLRKERIVDQEYLSRFQREAKAIGNLSHPNIVTVYDVGEYNDRPYIVMELLEGIPLDVTMKSTPKFSPHDAVPIAMQLASALHYAHSKGVVHRDIKPSNIIFSSNNKIKITDFGIAHFDNGDATQQTRMGDVLGTPQYMSPEQVLGEKIDGRSDLFSVGVILYQLLTGQRPFTGDTVATLMYQIANVEPPPIEQLDNSVPVSLRNTIKKLLAKKPDKRFQTGKELSETLAQVLKKVESNPTATGSQRAMPLRLKWSLTMVSIVMVTMLISFGIIYKHQYESMKLQLFDYGGSVVRQVASDSAINILSEDWVAIDIYVQGVNERKEFAYLTIVDRENTIRGATDPNLIGKTFTKKATRQLTMAEPKRTFFVLLTGENVDTFDFTTAIQFKDKDIGSVHLGISQEPLLKIAENTLLMMGALLFVVLAIVALISFLLANSVSASVDTVSFALQQLRANRFDYRINKTRKDEFGQIYTNFNNLAETLQQPKDPDKIQSQTIKY